jgi:hypothetical protein
LSISPSVSGNQVTVSFTVPDALSYGYTLQRSSDGGANYSSVTLFAGSGRCPAGSVKTYVDGGLARGTYLYRLYSYSNTFGGGGYSSVVTATVN